MSDSGGDEVFAVVFGAIMIGIVVVMVAWSLHKEAVCLTLKCPPGMTADNIRGECLCVVRPKVAP